MTILAVLAVHPASGVPILEVVDLHAAYGRIEVLRGRRPQRPEGRAVMALLGPNGAGKSTPWSRSSAGRSSRRRATSTSAACVQSAPPEDLARLGLCTVPEGRSVSPTSPSRENLTLMSYAGVATDAVLDTAYSLLPRLHQRRHQPRRHHVRRRAADAGDVPRLASGPRAAAARRAVDGPGAADRRRASTTPSRRSRRAASRSCASSSSRVRRCGCPTTPQ